MVDRYSGNDLLIGSNHRNRSGTIASGQNLKRGAVLGLNADNKYVLSDAGAGDGSQVPVAFLAVDADASGGDLVAPVYYSGEFNGDPEFVTFGPGHTVDTVDAAFARNNAPMHIRTLT